MAESQSPGKSLILLRETLSGIDNIAELELGKAMRNLVYRAGMGRLSDVESYAGLIANAAERLELYGPTPRFHSVLKAAMEDIQDMRTQVANALVDLDRTIGDLGRQLSDLFIRGNFVRFPDEIFALIFEFAGCEDLRSAINISGVCRRFRNIALSIPRLWNHIHLRGDRIGEATAQAERSKSHTLGLSLAIRIPSRPEDVYGRSSSADYRFILLDFVRTHALRVTSLEINLDYFESGADVQWSKYSTLSFPFLISLKLSMERGYTIQDPDDIDGVPQYDHWREYRTWDFPVLRTLHSVNFLPEISAGTLSKIKTFILEVEVDSDDCHMEWTLPGLVRYVSQMPSIEDLTISSLDMLNEHFPAANVDPLIMASLRRLSVNVTNYRKSHFESFFDAFEAYNLHALSINIRSECIPDLEWMTRKFWNTCRCRNLTDVSFIIRPRFRYWCDTINPRSIVVNHFLDGFPNFQNIYFECVADENHPFGFSSGLCAMRVKNCSLVDKWQRVRKDWISNMEVLYRRGRDGELDRCLVWDGVDGRMIPQEAVTEKTVNTEKDICFWRENSNE
ncbi:hypothetical protein SCHPADRAFT_1002716 [Schizopora paradoxa]|uniref:F-box domain-containing protein n=1 Tax=Schizopora paradoxa TaxID=27342 RepID=A0A0H2RLP7_9AGAM|nr:hypothetical protein SCHPADRAFT_1002716 [Schizopora paradoxa]